MNEGGMIKLRTAGGAVWVHIHTIIAVRDHPSDNKATVYTAVRDVVFTVDHTAAEVVKMMNPYMEDSK